MPFSNNQGFHLAFTYDSTNSEWHLRDIELSLREITYVRAAKELSVRTECMHQFVVGYSNDIDINFATVIL